MKESAVMRKRMEKEKLKEWRLLLGRKRRKDRRKEERWKEEEGQEVEVESVLEEIWRKES